MRITKMFSEIQITKRFSNRRITMIFFFFLSKFLSAWRARAHTHTQSYLQLEDLELHLTHRNVKLEDNIVSGSKLHAVRRLGFWFVPVWSW